MILGAECWVRQRGIRCVWTTEAVSSSNIYDVPGYREGSQVCEPVTATEATTAPMPITEATIEPVPTTITEVQSQEYICDTTHNFIGDVESVSQSTMCGSVESVLAECKSECTKIGCTAFFYQEHDNDLGCGVLGAPKGYQICVWTTEAVSS